ncbi:hypothetical protein BJ508DRAFT_79908 [Ascobolus immersus RN42]|uniref:Uncharacterized protein n=1 Tax=Ascobolus immersus RN42 TaxID=1160509 RepID=A0A3N4HCH9_ASCIM|nr:hypothetical protein BJ508DRAFT_79908 [Ascobolus immersus RN42]
MCKKRASSTRPSSPLLCFCSFIFECNRAFLSQLVQSRDHRMKSIAPSNRAASAAILLHTASSTSPYPKLHSNQSSRSNIPTLNPMPRHLAPQIFRPLSALS